MTASWSRRTDEEQRGSSKDTTINVGDTYPKSNNDISTAFSEDTYPKRRNNDTTSSTASSSATSNYFPGNPSPWLGSSSNTSMMNAAATTSSPTSASPYLSRKPLLLTTQTHGSDGNQLEGHHLPPSNWQHEYTDQQQEDLLGVAKHHHHQLQEQEEAERTNYGTTTAGPGSSTGALLLQRNEVDPEHQKSIQGFPSLDAGIPKAHHAIDVMNSSDGDSNSTKNVKLPHKPSHPYDSQSISNVSESPRDIEKTLKEQAKEAIIEKMNAYFESKYNTQVSHKFPQKVRDILQFVLFMLSSLRVLDIHDSFLESYFILLILGSIHI